MENFKFTKEIFKVFTNKGKTYVLPIRVDNAINKATK